MRSIALCLALLPWPALAGTLTVGEGLEHATLALALDAAADGDVIVLGAGEHEGGVIVSKSVTIEGQSADDTVLHAVIDVLRISPETVVTVRNMHIDARGERAIEAAGADMVLEALKVTGGRHDDRGGGVSFTGAELTVDGCAFEDNRSVEGLGGHLYVRAADVIIRDSTFTRGIARRGGAVYSGVGTLSVSGSSFIGNAVRGDRIETEDGPDIDEGMGGALASEAADLTIDDSRFDGNQAERGRGGHISVLSGELVMTDVHLVNGLATERYGGGLATFNATVRIEGGTVMNNQVTTKALEDNDAANGAGIFLHGTQSATASISGTVFGGNISDLHGGAVRVAGGTATITDATFTGNDGYFGGGVHVATPYEVTIEGSTFDSNKARFGAAIRWRPPTGTQGTSKLTLLGNTFTSNIADDYGGVLYGRAGGTFEARNNHMAYNVGTLGGALMLWGIRDAEVVGNTLCLNTATDGDVPDGGGIASYLNGEDGHIRIANNVFAENRATAWGGGVSLVQDLNVEVVNNHFLANRSAEGGGLSARDTTVLVRNNLFAWTAGGDGFAGNDGADVTFAYNAYFSNLETAVDDGFALAATDLSEVDPLVADYSPNALCDDDVYTLLAASPLIDAGDPELLDPDGGVSDIGAFGGPDAPADLFVDADEDGHTAVSDCDDDNKDVHPGAVDVPYDGIDQDCSGADLTDVDLDGHDGGPDGPDCDDTDPSINPDATETWYDGVDGDCDARDDYDQDGDGVPRDEDCDDRNALVYPGAPETEGDGVDSDCSGRDGESGCGGCNSSSPAGAPWLLLVVAAAWRRRKV